MSVEGVMGDINGRQDAPEPVYPGIVSMILRYDKEYYQYQMRFSTVFRLLLLGDRNKDKANPKTNGFVVV